MRRWYRSRPVATGSAPFRATSGFGPLDNVSVLELLEDGGFGELTEEQGAAIGRIDANSRRLLLLIDDLLVLSRVQDRGLENQHVDLDLRDVVVAAHDVVAPAAERSTTGIENAVR